MRGEGRRDRGAPPSAGGAALALLLALALGCGPGPDGTADAAADGRGDERAEAPAGDAAAPAGTADVGTTPVETARAKTAPAGTADAGATPTDTSWLESAETRPDSAVAGRFFVRVASDVEPATVAERHGIEPEYVVPETEPVRAFVARLTWGEVSALERDSSVVSLAREIEGRGAGGPPTVRTVPTTDTGGR